MRDITVCLTRASSLWHVEYYFSLSKGVDKNVFQLRKQDRILHEASAPKQNVAALERIFELLKNETVSYPSCT